MKQYTWSFVLFMVVAIGSWFARSMGWYNDYWYTDIILHTLSGAAFSLIWIGMNSNSRSPAWLLLLGTVSFAVFGSVLWEFWEFAGWRIMPSHTQFYIPELGDSLSDILCGAVGSIFTFILSKLSLK